MSKPKVFYKFKVKNFLLWFAYSAAAYAVGYVGTAFVEFELLNPWTAFTRWCIVLNVASSTALAFVSKPPNPFK